MKNFKLKFNEDLCKCLVCKKKNIRLMQLGSKNNWKMCKCMGLIDGLKNTSNQPCMQNFEHLFTIKYDENV